MYGDYYFPGEELDQMAEGGIPSRYKNMGFSKVGAKKKSTRPGKKWMVLAKKGDKYKVVHGGDSKMKDFKQHGSAERKKRFWDRMGGRDSAKANDPFSPLYWHKKFGTWQKGGEANPMDVIRSGMVPAGAPRGEFNIVPPFENDPNLRRHMFNFPQDYAGWRTFAKNAKNSPAYFLPGTWDVIPEGRPSSDYVNQQLKYSAGKTFPSVRLNGWANGGEPQNPGFQALPPYVQAKIMANMMYGGDMYAMGGMPCYECGGKVKYVDGGEWFNEDSQDFYKAGGQMIRRADGSYSRRGLWDNIRANRGSGKKPTKQMLEQEARIRAAEQAYGGQMFQDGGMSSKDKALAEYNDYKSYVEKARQAIGTNDTKTLKELGRLSGMYGFDDLAVDFAELSRLRKQAGLGEIEEFKILLPHVGQQLRGAANEILGTHFKKGGIHIDPAKKGTFKAQATRMGLSVQEAAKKILDAPEGSYSPEMRRKANFAMNFAKEYGGMPEYQFAGSTEEPLFEFQTPITGLQPKGFDMRMFDSLEEAKKRMENPSDRIQPASPIKPIEPERGFSLANQAAYVTGLRALEAMTRDNSAEKRYNASQTLADSYGPVQRMNPFDWYGEYVTNQGDLLNPRQMAPVQFRGMDYPMYMEEGGQVVELDDKQIKQLLALGAEIEMLDQ